MDRLRACILASAEHHSNAGQPLSCHLSIAFQLGLSSSRLCFWRASGQDFLAPPKTLKRPIRWAHHLDWTVVSYGLKGCGRHVGLMSSRTVGWGSGNALQCDFYSGDSDVEVLPTGNVLSCVRYRIKVVASQHCKASPVGQWSFLSFFF